MSLLRPNVVAARARLAKGQEVLLRRHEGGASGVELCSLLTNLRDAVLLDLIDTALTDLGEPASRKGLLEEIAVVAHGGYGRRDLAPYSDVDVMILHRRGVEARVARLAERILRDVFDVGLVLGHSVRTPWQACRLACRDPEILTSLAESRLLVGSVTLFDGFLRRLRRAVRLRAGWLTRAIDTSRAGERARYGETVFLLEPNLKRSRGGLRDLQLLRWIGFVRHGTTAPRELHALGALAEDDLLSVERAGEFLLCLRNELHFHAGQANDVLSRAEQLRIAELRGYQPAGGLLAVEQFMQDYFRYTNQASHVVTRFLAKASTRSRLGGVTTALFGHRVEDDLRVGPAGMMATRRGLRRLHGDLTAIMRLVDLANLHDVPIAARTWEEVCRHLPPPNRTHHAPRDVVHHAERDEYTEPPPAAACGHFLSLMAHPARLGPLLRDLHEAAILERFIPEFARARGLLQFNQYHKYTVDEHSFRAVEFATDLLHDDGPVGRVYRGIADKGILHLALLLHDLGKGHLEDHREVGLKIAERAAARLGLPPREAETLKFLVHKHLRMNHLAFRRDTSDEGLVVQFAVQVGSPEVLQMLYVLTAADLGAVGPDVWDGWKSEVLTDLYHRTMQQLAGDSPATTVDRLYGERREEIRTCLGPGGRDAWFVRHIDALTPGYLSATAPPQAAADLQLLHDMPPGGIAATAQYLPDAATVQVTVGTSEQVTPGIFHKLTGALSSRGLEIRSAQIHTLADGLVLDRFWVRDPDFSGAPPRQRLEEITRSLEHSLRAAGTQPPAFRQTWQMAGQRKVATPQRSQVNSDNSTSDRYTIIDVITHDRTGLLYAISRTLFELGLSVWRAKIGTFLDQVVDVFYVTDQDGRKVTDQGRLDETREKLLAVIEDGSGQSVEPPIR